MKIRPVGAKLFHADGRTDRNDEANSSFSQLCERALKSSYLRQTSKLIDWTSKGAANEKHHSVLECVTV
jgi:hypothetical protein